MDRNVMLKVSQILVGEHALRAFEDDDEIEELAKSIARVGILQALIVVKTDKGYELISGHRRLAAAMRVGVEKVPCFVRDDNPAGNSEVAFAENLFRKALTPVELACGIRDALDTNTMTGDELAAALHRSKDWVNRQLAILTWPGDVLEGVQAGWLSVSAAENLALIPDDIYRQFLLKQAQENGATTRITAAWLQAYRSLAPADQAITAVPVSGESPRHPAVPQAPCICCSNIFRTDELAHVPVCVSCIKAIRDANR